MLRVLVKGLHIVIEAVQFARIHQSSSREFSEIVGSIQTEGFLKRDTYLIHSVSDELRTDEALFAVPLYIQVNGEKAEDIIRVNVPVIGEMPDHTVIFLFLFIGHRNAVDLTGDEIIFTESTFADGLLIEGSGQRKGMVGTAEAVHFRETFVS